MLPPVPEHFVGREVDMYEILESLRVDDVVRVGGPQGSGKATVVSAVSRYILKRPKSFLINSVFWLPPPKGVTPDEDSLYGDLCKVTGMMIDSEDDIWEEEEYTEARERILVEMEGKRVILVVDGRSFVSEAAGENLELFLSHLLNECGVKIILITATEADASGKTSRSRSEETIIHLGPLDYRSTAILFGNSSKFVSSAKCSAAYSAEEFASYLVPPSVAKLGDQSKSSSRRQAVLFERMGSGNPSAIVEAASKMSEKEFNDLLRFAQRPEVNVDSAGALESEILKRRTQMDKALRGKNYLRAKDLSETLEELQSLHAKFPSLSELQAQERKMKRELTDLLAARKYDEANLMKRKMLALKRVIMKEKDAQPARGASSKYTASGRLQELQAQMNNMLAMAEKMNMEKSMSELESSQRLADDAERAIFTIYREDSSCAFEISCGDLVKFDHPTGLSGIFCWTNEACDLSTYETGTKIAEQGGHRLLEDVSSLETIAVTQWGPVKCGTGEAVIIGPRTYGKLFARFLIMAVSPLSPTNDDDDWDGDFNKDEDALHYLETGLRASYRSCFRMIRQTSLEAVAIPTITTKDTGGTYERTLRVGLQTVLEESKFSKLSKIVLMPSSPKEAVILIKMASSMGLSLTNG